MKVGILRNAEAKTNAGIFRITDALIDMKFKPIIISRSRFSNSNRGKFTYKTFKYKGESISNYEMQLKTELGGGMNNLVQLFLYQFLTLIWLLKNREKLDVIHAFDLDAGVPVLIFSRLTKKKFVYHIADFYIDSRQGIPSKLKKYVKKLEYYIISKADVTIICTEERKDQIKGSFPKKLYVIHNSPIEEFQTTSKKNIEIETNENNNGLLTLGYVGGLSDKRFIDKVLNYAVHNSHVTLKIAGFGRIEDAVKEATSKYPNIHYYGRVNYENALELYSQCDVMFAIYDPSVPNHKYSAPNKVYEAMMLGLPIIVAKGTGIDSLVEKEKIGFSINYNEKDFSNVIKYLIDNKDQLQQFKSNSEQAYNYYSWNNMKKKLQEIYACL